MTMLPGATVVGDVDVTAGGGVVEADVVRGDVGRQIFLVGGGGAADDQLPVLRGVDVPVGVDAAGPLGRVVAGDVEVERRAAVLKGGDHSRGQLVEREGAGAAERAVIDDRVHAGRDRAGHVDAELVAAVGGERGDVARWRRWC
jgi:hypothetical protein